MASVRSKTEANLHVALAGEADANRRYLAYGIQALNEGRPRDRPAVLRGRRGGDDPRAQPPAHHGRDRLDPREPRAGRHRRDAGDRRRPAADDPRGGRGRPRGCRRVLPAGAGARAPSSRHVPWSAGPLRRDAERGAAGHRPPPGTGRAGACEPCDAGRAGAQDGARPPPGRAADRGPTHRASRLDPRGRVRRPGRPGVDLRGGRRPARRPESARWWCCSAGWSRRWPACSPCRSARSWPRGPSASCTSTSSSASGARFASTRARRWPS